MARDELLAAAVLALTLSAACKKESLPGVEDSGSALAPPAPSSATVTSPLSAAPDYTNEMQAAHLRDQAAAMGIGRLSKPGDISAGSEEDRPPIGYDEGLARTRALAGEFEAERRSMERGKPKAVPLTGSTPGLISNDNDAP